MSMYQGGRGGGGGRGGWQRSEEEVRLEQEAQAKLRRLKSSRKRFLGFLELRREAKQRARQAPRAGSRWTNPYLRRYAQWLRPHLVMLTVLFVLALVEVGLNLVKPLLTKLIVDDAILAEGAEYATQVRLLTLYGSLMIAAALFSTALTSLTSYHQTLLNSRVTFRLRQRLHEHLLNLPLKELSEMKAGGVVARLSGDVDNTSGLVQSALLSPAVAALQAVWGIAIIFMLNWRLALGIAVIVPPVMLLHLAHVRKIRPLYRSVRDDRSAVDGRVAETFSGIRVVRSFRREVREQGDYAVGHNTAIRKSIYAHVMQMAVSSGWNLLMPAVTVVLWWYGGYLIVHDRHAGLSDPTTIGDLTAFQGYIFLVITPVIRIVSAMSQTQRALAAMERVFDLLDKPQDMPDAPEAVPAPARVEEIRFEHLHFAYDPERPVITDFNLTVPGGSIVALVGPSGAGKTTLTDLIARFYDPTEGRILVNGIDLRQFQRQSYRTLLGIVQQDVFLFDGTVRDNIAYGRRHASAQEVEEAARRANAHEFIANLPEGYDTFIGERGVKLSGGQRQRLSIARAILADPQILILDEATSNLDSESEQLIQAALEEMYRNRTTFVIAHRLSTVTHADLIVVLEQGRIVELGTHQDLMAQGGKYREMIERQWQGPEAAQPAAW